MTTITEDDHVVAGLRRAIHKRDYRPTREDVLVLMGQITRLTQERDQAEIRAVRAVAQTYEALKQADIMSRRISLARATVTSQTVATIKGDPDTAASGVLAALAAVNHALHQEIEEEEAKET